jgi:hypothetical protein
MNERKGPQMELNSDFTRSHSFFTFHFKLN